MRLAVAVWVGRTVRWVLRLCGGGGTALPGLIVDRLCPGAFRLLAKKYQAIVVVSGTNGKTTTTRLISAILRDAGMPVVSNRSGSNLMRGLLTALIAPPGRPEETVAVLEVDERVLPRVLRESEPQTIVLLNLFRDQLDRNTEVDDLARKWEDMIEDVTLGATLVTCADDPETAWLGTVPGVKQCSFGINDTKAGRALSHTADTLNCPACGCRLQFETSYLAHLGVYWCRRCQFARPEPSVVAEKLGMTEWDVLVDVSSPFGMAVLRTKAGVHNVYNALAAMSVGGLFGIHPVQSAVAITKEPPAFGRDQRIAVDGKTVRVCLVKNPAGFDAVVDILLTGAETRYVLFAVENKIADGEDVSWLWDVSLGDLRPRVRKAWTSGSRAYDMAVRLQHADLPAVPMPDLGEALDRALGEIPSGDVLWILSTYSALMDVNRLLVKRGAARPFWED